MKRTVKRALFASVPDAILSAIVRRKLPRSAQLEATTACNLSCPLCVTHDTPRGRSMLSRDDVLSVVKGCGSRLKFVSFHVLGEPLLNPELFAMITDCEAANVRTSFSTNGLLLGRHRQAVLDSGLSFLSVAIDGVDAQDYERYRKGGDFNTVVQNTRELVRARETRGATRPTVQAQMVMFSYNEDREREAQAFLGELGTDIVSLKRPAYTAHPGVAADTFLSQVDHENQARRYARPVSSPEKLYRNQRMCPQLERATVLSDGSVVSCCLDALGESSFGNLRENDFATIWRGRAHDRVLRDFMSGTLATCRHCTLGYQDLDDAPEPLQSPASADEVISSSPRAEAGSARGAAG
ncbi:MAG: hypothetical protein DHS20C15_31170 [Planctomycetota bacterium]|nr:MAG: hypothetical protein DHS20C15_31170 [Planctomycetota bacterium]